MRGLPLLPLLLLLAVAACAQARPLDYQSVDNRDGPGLLTGPTGRFVIEGPR